MTRICQNVLKADFPGHDVYTVGDMNWNGMKNGELMRAMLNEHFDALITFDKNLQHQQNFNKYQLPVIVLNAFDNTYITLTKLAPAIIKILDGPLTQGPVVVP